VAATPQVQRPPLRSPARRDRAIGKTQNIPKKRALPNEIVNCQKKIFCQRRNQPAQHRLEHRASMLRRESVCGQREDDACPEECRPPRAQPPRATPEAQASLNLGKCGAGPDYARAGFPALRIGSFFCLITLRGTIYARPLLHTPLFHTIVRRFFRDDHVMNVLSRSPAAVTRTNLPFS